ncbi:hypothetical protein M0Q28_06665 [Patescibacteria group bacterium]|jgi:hypothetical protein|nr:hypothetical protein [Patescibacteria group bacterium]
MALREREYRIKGGDAVEDDLTVSLRENLKLTFRLFQRALKMPIDDLISETGFSHLMNGQKARNRLTHPKSKLNLEVSDEALAEAESGSEWYFDTIESLLDRSAVESIYYRRFAPPPADADEMVHRLVEAGAILKTKEGDFIVGKMVQLGPSKWFYWLIDYEADHPGGRIVFILRIIPGP